MRKVYGSRPTRCPDWTLAHCSPSSKWVPSGNTREIKAARKGTGHPTSHTDGSGYVFSLTGTLLRTKVYGTTFTLYLYRVLLHSGAMNGSTRKRLVSHLCKTKLGGVLWLFDWHTSFFMRTNSLASAWMLLHTSSNPALTVSLLFLKCKDNNKPDEATLMQ